MVERVRPKIANTDKDSPKYLLGDHLGSTHVILNAMGKVEQTLEFDPWGMRVNAGSTAVNQLTNQGYTGHEMDDEVGLINMNARVYDPVLGRFLSADPVLPDASDMQQYNRYSYVMNNPLKFIDPTGNIAERPPKRWGLYGYGRYYEDGFCSGCAYGQYSLRPVAFFGLRWGDFEGSHGTITINLIPYGDYGDRPSSDGGSADEYMDFFDVISSGDNNTSLELGFGPRLELSFGFGPRREDERNGYYNNGPCICNIDPSEIDKAIEKALRGWDNLSDKFIHVDLTHLISLIVVVEINKALGNVLSSDKDGDEGDDKSGKRNTVPGHTGPPGGYVEGPRRGREYGPDGKPLRDYDKPHQGHETPHVHEWPGGVREHPGRDYSPWPRSQ